MRMLNKRWLLRYHVCTLRPCRLDQFASRIKRLCLLYNGRRLWLMFEVSRRYANSTTAIMMIWDPLLPLLFLMRFLTCSKWILLLSHNRMISATTSLIVLFIIIFCVCQALLCLCSGLYSLPFFFHMPRVVCLTSTSVWNSRVSFVQRNTTRGV
jgi:hypothetical protein